MRRRVERRGRLEAADVGAMAEFCLAIRADDLETESFREPPEELLSAGVAHQGREEEPEMWTERGCVHASKSNLKLKHMRGSKSNREQDSREM